MDRLKEELENALGDHGKWKLRLRHAVHTGQCDIDVHTASSDCHCAFGKWIHHHGHDLQRHTHYQSVKTLHTEFHHRAGQTLAAALSGHQEKALKDLGLEGDFSRVAAKLTLEILHWLRQVEQHTAHSRC